MPAQERLSSTEQNLAYLAGLGIVVIIAALILLGLGTFDNDNVPISLLLVGVAALIIGIGGWLYIVKPWTSFDDLKTPYYTGHETPAAAAPIPAEQAVIPAPPAAIQPVAAEPAAIVPVPAAEPPAVVVESPAEVVPVGDDLVMLEGIGPKSAAALRTAGITTFAQIARMSPADLEKIVKDQKVRLVGSTATWPEQAALAAAGDLSGLEALRARIKRGGMMDNV
jgi:predicted flap endonuclease-1-like 5' DNA nuclease